MKNRAGTTRRALVRDAMLITAGIVAAGGLASTVSGEEAMAQGAGLPGRIPAEDRLDLLELMALYAWAYDTQDEAGLAATFTADGELEVFGNVLASGVMGFGPFLAQAGEMKGESGWQHLADHHVFRDFDGGSCTIYSYYTMAEANAQGAEARVRAIGYYISQCLRTPEGWRFARRQVVRWNGRKPFA